MKKNTFLIRTLLFSTSLALLSCSGASESTSQEDVVIEVADDPETIKANEQAIRELKKQQEIESAATTSMKVDKEIHDFGKVMEGSDNTCTFIVTNTGTKPLILSDVKASCGCTTPSKPEKPIAPGKSDKIEVGFKPTGKGENEKTVTITANTDPKITILKVKANVQ